MRPGLAADLVAVLQDAERSGWTPSRILHLWQVCGERREDTNSLQTFDACLGPGYMTLTALVQALHEQAVDHEVQVTVVANGVAAVEGEVGPSCWEKPSRLRWAPKMVNRTSPRSGFRSNGRTGRRIKRWRFSRASVSG